MSQTDRFDLRLPEEMGQALRQEAEKQDKPKAALIREALQAYLEKRGYKIKKRVKWGGQRKSVE